MIGSAVRKVAAGHPGDSREHLVHAIAIAMHEITCGSWEAAGYDTRLDFTVAADRAVVALGNVGHDLLTADYEATGWKVTDDALGRFAEAASDS